MKPSRLLAGLALVMPWPALAAPACNAPVTACTVHRPGGLALLVPGRVAKVMVDPADDVGVVRAADDLAADLAKVGGGKAQRIDTPLAGTVVIAGTLGHSAPIDALVRSKRLDVGGLAGQWEGYVEQIVEHPAPGVDRALVIVGADRRGTIFGLYDISAKAGVSPWNWWADVPAIRHATLYLTPGRVADHPVVKYRGIFINDEEPAFGGWARTRFGGVDHQAYQHLFSLLLRLKANYLWPAMWGKSLWQDDPASAPLAREMGIILGTSHHEPMERANVEWKRQGGGAWDYTTNASALQAFWRAGIARRGVSEDPVTVGMRGDGDEPMTEGTAIPLLERIVTDQRRIIATTTGWPAAETPQVWALYKEVQDYYDQGMRVPDDVTLLFSDDNWGNLRRLPPPGERRAGGSGVYYHFDYVGDPRNYKWLDTNAIPRVWQQMRLAHDYGADRLWIVNVGDLKPMEYATSFFLAMAWNPDAMTQAAMQAYPVRWAQQQFGLEHGVAIGALLARYGQLASARKPELLDADSYGLASGEWGAVLAAWNALDAAAQKAGGTVPHDQRDAYDELVLHRIDAMANLHRLWKAVAEQRAAARAGTAATADFWGKAARGYFAEDAALRRRYEGLAGGKWSGMMAQTHIGYTGWQEPPRDTMPTLAPLHSPYTPPPPAPLRPQLALAADGGRFIDGAGFRWERIAGFTAHGAAMMATPASAPSVEHPGGASPQIAYAVTLPSVGPIAVSIVAAPGLDVRGTGKQRVALSLDNGLPMMIDLLAGDDDAHWRRAVIENRRVATATMRVGVAGKHVLHLWLVDPQVVIERIDLAAAR
jgi:hypothetical protein